MSTEKQRFPFPSKTYSCHCRPMSADPSMEHLNPFTSKNEMKPSLDRSLLRLVRQTSSIGRNAAINRDLNLVKGIDWLPRGKAGEEKQEGSHPRRRNGPYHHRNHRTTSYRLLLCENSPYRRTDDGAAKAVDNSKLRVTGGPTDAARAMQ